jgi:methyltransferase, FkbM family
MDVNEAVLSHGYVRVKKCRDGYFVYNANDSYIGRSLDLYGEYSYAEALLLQQFLRPGMIFAEVGANIGAHTVGLARRVGQQGRVLAYEPQRIVFQNLCANIAINGLMNVECHWMALGERSGMLNVAEFDFTQPGNFGVFSADRVKGHQRVPIATLDDHFPYNWLHALKIDVEGMEVAVLRGAANTISRYKPMIYVENDRPEQSEALISLLFDYGYRLWWHAPHYYSVNNFFSNAENVFGVDVSLNMLGIHRDTKAEITGFEPVTDPAWHPALAAAAEPAP